MTKNVLKTLIGMWLTFKARHIDDP